MSTSARQKMSKPERLALARRRIENILRERILCTEKQLESKISESGPEDKLCDPHVLSEALKQLKRERRVDSLDGPSGSKFYFMKSVYDPSSVVHNKRRDYLFQLYERYRSASQKQPLCGDVLESFIWKRMNNSSIYTPMGSQSHPIIHFGTVQLPGALDLILIPKFKSNSAVLVEAKNIREWIYPTSIELWQLIQKAIVFSETGMETVPVIVSVNACIKARIFAA
jgi:hypothetical protein